LALVITMSFEDQRGATIKRRRSILVSFSSTIAGHVSQLPE
jgi:hypothetical protein